MCVSAERRERCAFGSSSRQEADFANCNSALERNRPRLPLIVEHQRKEMDVLRSGEACAALLSTGSEAGRAGQNASRCGVGNFHFQTAAPWNVSRGIFDRKRVGLLRFDGDNLGHQQNAL